MKKAILLIITLFIAGVFSWTAYAEEPADLPDYPWEKFSINAGGFLSSLDSNARVGTGIGIEIDLEDALGMKGDQTVFRLGTTWRFTENRRHQFDLSWFYFHRDASKTLGDTITIEDPNDPDGPPIVIEAGTHVSSYLNWDIFKLDYSYSFIQDDRIDLAGEIGLFIMPIALGMSASGLLEGDERTNITAPLPTLGLRIDFAITPEWILRVGTQFFYLEYNGFKGELIYGEIAIEYNPWENWGFGLGVDSLRASVKSDDEDWPGIDMRGEFEMNYIGVQLYLRYFF